MELEQFRKSLLEQGKQAGFSECEVYFQKGKEFEVLVLEGEISHYENSATQGVCFRGIMDGKMGYAYSEKISQDAIEFLIKQAEQNADIIEEDMEEELFSGSSSYPSFSGFSEQLKELSGEEKIENAKQMEQAALKQGQNQVAIDYCVLGYEEERTEIYNTKGLSLGYEKNGVSAYVSAIAHKGEEIKTGSEYWMDNIWHDFDPIQIGQKAAENAVSHLGAESVPSGSYRVLLENEVMSGLLSAFCIAFYGENVEKGFSMLRGKLKNLVASPHVTLRDDALLSGKTGSVPFDDEGVACKNKIIINKGILETFLYNLKTAKTAGVESTGNGFKMSLQSPVKTTCTNFYIAPGEKAPDEMIATLGEGLLITDVAGLHAGTNGISGDFSLSAEGFLVENGVVGKPIEQITIAGNFFNLLRNIEMCGNNLRFAMPNTNGTIGAPMVLVKEIDVSGL